MVSILYSEVNILCIMFLLLIYSKVKPENYTQQKQILFRKVLLSNCILFVLDVMWIFINSRTFLVGPAVNWALNILYYISSGIVGFYWFVYSESVQNSQLVRDKKHIFLCAVPVMLLSVMTLASIKTGWLFYIDEANVYHRGPFYALQLLISYGYVVFTAGKALVRSGRAVEYSKKVEYRTLACFVIAPLIAGMIQVFFPSIPSLSVGTTFGALYVFLTMQEQLISVDALTGLNNRSKLMQHLFDRMERPDARKHLFLVMMDLDYFKTINDGYGHVEGDNALCMTADVLKGCCKDDRYFIARYGGDEYVAVCELDSKEQIEEFCHNIADAMQIKSDGCPYKLSLSIGYAEYTSGITTPQDFIKQADAKLYEAKQARRNSYTARR